MPGKQELEEFYNNYHKTKQYSDKSASKVRRAKKRIRTFFRQVRKKTLLDVGCNIGAGAEAGRQLGFKALGIDIDEDAINKANNLFRLTDYKFISLEKIRSTNEKFGAIYCSEVIEHLSELSTFVKCLYDVLEEDGILYITTPDIGHYSLRNNYKKISQWDSIRPPEHLMYFNKKSLSLLLKSSGFKKVRFQFSFKPGIKVVAYK
jgi:2-polyprenyl-3-methyl-5-hydroxy-6-metoxy-1,4-benzoquinol methylase|tara:strand:+ start:257 stop:871 length:615 start_codon:yes stop_codon:yes gene_type:complete